MYYLSFVVRWSSLTRMLTIATILCCFVVFHSFSYALAKHNCNKSIIATTPDTQFTIDKDGTVSDTTTGLMWMRCSLGQEWNGTTCTGKAVALPWANALSAAEKFEFAGYTDWRLPNKNELESIVEDRCFAPAINSNIFPATPSAYFWSSTPYTPVAEGSWSVDFGYGAINATVKSGLIHIRMVRDEEY